jgi:hypothetical protein
MPKENPLDLIATHNEQVVALYDRAAIDKYFISLKPLPTSSPALTRVDKAGEPQKEVRGDKTLWCTTTTYTLAANPDEIVLYTPDVETLRL